MLWPMRLLVEGEISATRYKKLVAKLKGLSKTDLWKILDHYIFHVMEDRHVDDLLTLLEQGALKDVTADVSVDPADLKFDELKEKTGETFRRYGQDAKSIIVSTLPTQDDLLKFKSQLDLLYDSNFFETYLIPELKVELAAQLVSFAKENEVPVQPHWIEFSGTE